MASGPRPIPDRGCRPLGTTRTPSQVVPGLHRSRGPCGCSDGPSDLQATLEGKKATGNDVDTHLVSAPVPGGHDGQPEGHSGPREVRHVGVSEHVHGIHTWQVAGRVGNSLGWYGLGVGRCQLLIPADLVESCSDRSRMGLLVAGGLAPSPPLLSPHRELPVGPAGLPTSPSQHRAEHKRGGLSAEGNPHGCFLCI